MRRRLAGISLVAQVIVPFAALVLGYVTRAAVHGASVRMECGRSAWHRARQVDPYRVFESVLARHRIKRRAVSSEDHHTWMTIWQWRATPYGQLEYHKDCDVERDLMRLYPHDTLYIKPNWNTYTIIIIIITIIYTLLIVKIPKVKSLI